MRSKKSWSRRRATRQRLQLTAPAAGTVFPPPWTLRRDDPNERLHILVWNALGTGEPRRPPRRTHALLSDRRSAQARSRDGHRADRPQPRPRRREPGRRHQARRLRRPSETIHSHIVEVAESELKVTPKRLTTKSQGEVPTKTDPETGIEKPMSTSYQARAPIEDPDGELLIGLRGQARVHTRWMSLGARAWRPITHMFSFKMG